MVWNIPLAQPHRLSKGYHVNHPVYLTSNSADHFYCFFKTRQGKYAEAEKLYDQAMAAWKTSVGSSNPIVADIMNSQAVVLTKQVTFSY